MVRLSAGSASKTRLNESDTHPVNGNEKCTIFGNRELLWGRLWGRTSMGTGRLWGRVCFYAIIDSNEKGEGNTQYGFQILFLDYDLNTLGDPA